MKCVWHLPRRRVSIRINLNPVYMLCISFYFICVFSFFPLFTVLHFFIALPSADCCDAEKDGETFCGRFEFEDAVFSVKRGDYSFLMEKVCQNLEKAKVWQRSTWKITESLILLNVKWTAWTFEAWVMFFFVLGSFSQWEPEEDAGRVYPQFHLWLCGSPQRRVALLDQRQRTYCGEVSDPYLTDLWPFTQC